MQDGTDSTTQGAGTDAPAAAPPAAPAPDNKIPFNNDEIEQVAETCAKAADPDIKWDDLSARAKHEYKELTVAAIQNKGVPTHLRSLIAGDYDQAVDFQTRAIAEFRQSPKWDEDAFVRGYK